MDLRKAHPHSLSPRALAIAGWTAFALAGVLFLLIAWNVSARGALAALDTRLADWLHAHATAPLTAVMLAVTHLNSTFAIGVWSALFAGVLARLRERYWILTLGLAVGGAMLLNLVLKQAYERARPRFEEPLIALETFSFPSGHTAAAVAFYGVLAAFLVSRFYDTRRRAACVGAALAAVALVAFSRLYLGAHYLSDVVAAVCSSTAWLVLCLAFGHALVRKRLKRRWIVMGGAGLGDAGDRRGDAARRLVAPARGGDRRHGARGGPRRLLRGERVRHAAPGAGVDLPAGRGGGVRHGVGTGGGDDRRRGVRAGGVPARAPCAARARRARRAPQQGLQLGGRRGEERWLEGGGVAAHEPGAAVGLQELLPRPHAA